MSVFQDEVAEWCIECFGEEIANDPHERCARLLEEVCELVQSIGLDQSHAMNVLLDAFSRPRGKPTQEVGGVMVTLAALCAATTMDMERCAFDELRRITRPDVIVHIRAKNAAKQARGL